MLGKKASVLKPSRVINIGSIHGMEAPKFDTFAYSASKAAVHHLTKHLARRLAPRNILVNAIAPGIFPSNMTKGILRVAEDKIIQSSLVKRLGEKKDIVGTVIYLSSEASGFMSGSVLVLDGGAMINSKL